MFSLFKAWRGVRLYEDDVAEICLSKPWPFAEIQPINHAA